MFRWLSVYCGGCLLLEELEFWFDIVGFFCNIYVYGIVIGIKINRYIKRIKMLYYVLEMGEVNEVLKFI